MNSTKTHPQGKPVITQQMIRLYDDYTHLTLDRRDFMRKLTALSGSAAAAAAIAPVLAANSARAAIVAEDDARVKTETITWPGAEGQTMSGYLVRPADATGPLPAVIVVHENRGLNAAHQGCGAPHGAGRLHGARAGFPDAGRRHAGGRGQGARDDRRARPRRRPSPIPWRRWRS